MSVVIKSVAGWPRPDKLFSALALKRGVFFLDSAWPGKTEPTYSFIGFNPFLSLLGDAQGVETTDLRVGDARHVRETGAPTLILEVLRKRLREFAASAHEQIPFTGGAVGYCSYELGAAWEKIAPRANPTPSESDSKAETVWAEFSFYDGVLAFAHETSQWFCVGNGCAGRAPDEIVENLTLEVSHAVAAGSPAARGKIQSEDKTGWYLAAVAKIKEFIAAGDIYQVNLAQAFHGTWQGFPADLYAQLRARTPAPFGAYLTTRDGHLLSSSPESFLRLRGDVLETRPIKGTRARGVADDTQQISELTSSAKERAELLMIVDLERNDLARVCRPGTIQVSELYGVETHPTVFHLVATVRGKLAKGRDAIDALRAMFPGGSITGAPKVRAMQIIRELEMEPRGPYTGAIGYFGFDGNADLNIAIRTIVLNGEAVCYHVGAGIVWDSHPESEYEETLAKGRALRAAIEGLSETGFRQGSGSAESNAGLHIELVPEGGIAKNSPAQTSEKRGRTNL